MQTAHTQFSANIKYVRELDILYHFLKDEQKLPNDLSDLLRAEIVYVVSALDKLIHELVRIGMIEIFNGNRPKTPTFEGFTISAKTLGKIKEMIIKKAENSNFVPQTPDEMPEYWFEQQIVLTHKKEAFQAPDKIKNALSLIWSEEYKWQKIATLLSTNQKDLQTTLNEIITRRNQIVHEADINLQTGLRNEIIDTDVTYSVDFIEKLGTAIYNLVK